MQSPASPAWPVNLLFVGLTVAAVVTSLALGVLVAGCTAVSRRLGVVGGTVLVGLATVIAIGCLRMRPRRRCCDRSLRLTSGGEGRA